MTKIDHLRLYIFMDIDRDIYLNYPVLFLNAENVFTYSDVLIFKPNYPNL